MNLTLEPGILERVMEHLRETLPLEGCGILAGRNNAAVRFIPIGNRLESPSAFEMDPGELIVALRELRDSGETLLAICHSHPDGPSGPSSTDIDKAYYPDAAHVIVSFKDRERPQVRAFRILGREVLEIGLHVIV